MVITIPLFVQPLQELPKAKDVAWEGWAGVWETHES